jgi:hypothetical protein
MLRASIAVTRALGRLANQSSAWIEYEDVVEPAASGKLIKKHQKPAFLPILSSIKYTS